MLRILFVVLISIAVIIAAIFLAGDLVWSLGGTRALDINGAAGVIAPSQKDRADWRHYGGDAGGGRYSSIDEITPENVGDLDVAWRFSTGDMTRRPARATGRMASEATPILIADALIFCTPFNEVIAIDPGTGAVKWRFDPEINLEQRPANQYTCRGVESYDRADGVTIFMGTNDSRLIAIDAETGSVMSAFGDNGVVRIDPGMELIWPGEFQITSSPVVVGSTVVVGSSISDNARRIAPVGAVRAFDVETGAPKWSFDPIPRDANAQNAGDWKGETPPVEGHANAWAPMSVDEARGLVFVPTSSPSPDFFGGLRPGDNRYANSVVALHGETGEVAWAFQTVHHDVWDYDVPAQPGLYQITVDGRPRDVVVQVTKTGLVFVLDRATGEPVIAVEERSVPQGGAPGEALSPTQPFPVSPPPVVPSALSPKDAWGLTWFDKKACADLIRNSDVSGLFTPPSERGVVLRPFSGGGANWGGAAFDPSRNLIVVNMSNIADHIQLIPQGEFEAARETYHGAEVSPQRGTPFGMKRVMLASPLGLPCTPPPWGVLAGIDVAKGEIVWRRTLGTIEDLSGGLLKTKLGTPNLGGPILTAGGVGFIGATLDHYLRAFAIETGDELWRARLPAPAMATPMTYEWEGRQYVVIYAGGYSRAETALSDELIAFALPDQRSR